MDIKAYVDTKRPDSKWKPYMITNVVYYIYPTGFPLGSGELPVFNKNNKCVIGLDKNKSNQLYYDNLCMFRCLAVYHKQTRIEESVKVYYAKWKFFTNSKIDMSDFKGIEFSQIHDFESCFNININVYELLPTGNVIPRYKSLCHFKDIMYLNLWKNHMSFIKFSGYAKKYQCPKCERHFDRHNWKRHLKCCPNITKYSYPTNF